MLRTMTPYEPELVKLCRGQSWICAALRAHSHPFEATHTTGEGGTVLSIAVQAGAPRNVIDSLLRANMHQLSVTRQFRGSILHEALVHRLPDDVLAYLLQAMVQYQQTISVNQQHPSQPFAQPTGPFPANLQPAQFRHFCVQTCQTLQGPNLLGILDDMGRTALHLLVEHAIRVADHEERSQTTLTLFRTLIRAHPESIKTMDADGNTPLIGLLLAQRRGPQGTRLETVLYHMVEQVVEICPAACSIPRKLPRPWRLHQHSSSPVGDGAPTPLYYALLNGRPIQLIRLLLQAHQRIGQKGSSQIISSHHEVGLHIAITTKASLAVVHQVLSDAPESALVGDEHGLTPIDWLWIRHVLDWRTNPMEFYSTRLISRRRHLPDQFVDMHNYASKQIPVQEDPDVPINRVAIRGLQEDMLYRLRVILPMVAASMTDEPVYKQGEPWSPLHAVCFLRCPIGMVRLVLNLDGGTTSAIRSRDLRAGRYPLHYAVARVGYKAKLPIGFSQSVQAVREESPTVEVLSHFPAASHEFDSAGQLPLHIYIDACKHHRTTTMIGPTEQKSAETEEQEVICQLLYHAPVSLERRDGKSGLLPWMQSAVGVGASLNTIFQLLRRKPTCISG